jgi:hypothetical protein
LLSQAKLAVLLGHAREAAPLMWEGVALLRGTWLMGDGLTREAFIDELTTASQVAAALSNRASARDWATKAVTLARTQCALTRRSTSGRQLLEAIEALLPHVKYETDVRQALFDEVAAAFPKIPEVVQLPARAVMARIEALHARILEGDGDPVGAEAARQRAASLSEMTSQPPMSRDAPSE